MMRLDKFLCQTGGVTRSEAKLLLKKGQVTVNGQTEKDGDKKINEISDSVVLQGKQLLYEQYRYYLLHKPAGVITATQDSSQKTVLDLLTGVDTRNLFPVGRLDKDTEGLLLLTDDGKTAHDLLSPRRHVDKVYYARTEGCLTEDDRAAFRSGMILRDGLRCLPAELEILSAGETSEALVTLREGKFHQVKRMLSARGKPVTYLRRVRMGNLPLDPELTPGEYRFLTTEEREILGAGRD